MASHDAGVHFCRQGQRVLSSRLFFRVVRRRAKIVAFDAPRGKGFKKEHVREALKKYPGSDALLFTHNEAPTGVVNPSGGSPFGDPPEGPLVLVDAVSSLGAMPCYPSRWRIDGLVSCSETTGIPGRSRFSR